MTTKQYVTRHYFYMEHEASGETGLIPAWIPKSADFNPVWSGTGMAHDMIEHGPNDKGFYHEEVAAFGRVLLVRSPTKYAGSEETWAMNLGRELVDVLERACEDHHDRDGAPEMFTRCGDRRCKFKPGSVRVRNLIDIAANAAAERLVELGGPALEAAGSANLEYLAGFYRDWMTYGVMTIAPFGHGQLREFFRELQTPAKSNEISKQIRIVSEDCEPGDVVTVQADVLSCEFRFRHHPRSLMWVDDLHTAFQEAA